MLRMTPISEAIAAVRRALIDLENAIPGEPATGVKTERSRLAKALRVRADTREPGHMVGYLYDLATDIEEGAL